ncbi:P2Y purinoceptor 12-like, partial [Neolamprologus brichardi]|uniref:P2Y purinoceptor 12-like n=1 Tax=Neolamprologus brichardi TaxID=32507 RepID=UPI001643B7AC
RGQRHVSSVTIFLKNLAAADFLISLCLPLRIMKYANIKSEIIRKVYCNFGASAFYLNMYASIMFMGFIAANRYPGVQKYNPNLILGGAVLTRWMPYAYTSKTNSCSWSQVFFYVKEMAVFVSVLNVCLDPLIYFIFCKAFRARLSLRNALATTEVSTVAANADRRSSDTQSSIKRKISLTPTTRTSVL